MKNFIKIWRFFLRLFLHPIYFLSYLSLRDKNIWVFGSGDGERFADNSKYLFLYTANNKKNKTRAIWISKSKKIVSKLNKRGYESYYNWSLRGVYYLLKAGYYFTDAFSDATNYWLSGGAKKINMWHGIPLKKISYDAKRGKGSQYFNAKGFMKILYKIGMPWLYEKNDYLPIASISFLKIFSSAFRENKNKFIITGYPRNDMLFKNFKNSDLGSNKSIINRIKKLKETNKLIFYLPTFRDNNSNPFEAGKFNFTQLNHFLTKNKAIFISKFHRLAKIKNNHSSKYERIVNLPFEVDIYSILSFMDILVTDYSSIYFDFLLLNKPIIFYSYDLKEYMKNRELYFDYKKLTPGPKAYSFNDFLNLMQKAIDQEDGFKKEREEMRAICFKYLDGKASERIFLKISANNSM